MLRTLLESQARSPRRAAGTVVSIAAHTMIIGLAIAVTARAKAVSPSPHEIIQPVRFQPAVHRPPASSSHSRTTGTTVLPPVITGVVMPPLNIPKTLPPIDLPRPITEERDFDGQHVQLGWALPGGPNGDLSRPTDGIFTTETVDRAAMARAGNPAPVYPPALRSASLEGSVVARFVVDTSGRAEPASITFPEATQALFAEAVRQALLKSRYLPARIGSRPVRQLVEQRFSFTLRSTPMR